jgi:hypothetical protein
MLVPHTLMKDISTYSTSIIIILMESDHRRAFPVHIEERRLGTVKSSIMTKKAVPLWIVE